MILPMGSKEIFPFHSQENAYDCGPTCLLMISAYFGVDKSRGDILNLFPKKDYASLKDISNAAMSIGLTAFGVRTSFAKIAVERPFPCIVHWNYMHFVVVYDISDNEVMVADPGIGLVRYKTQDFIQRWSGFDADAQTKNGIALLLSMGNSLSS